MPFIEWNPAKLSTKVDAMDKEHIKLLALMNDLYDLYKAKAPATKQLDSLAKLLAYAAEHFRDEEAYMQKIKYPNFASHKKIHDELMKRLREFESGVKAGTSQVNEEIFAFLKVWITSHIMGIDIKYGEHATKKAA